MLSWLAVPERQSFFAGTGEVLLQVVLFRGISSLQLKELWQASISGLGPLGSFQELQEPICSLVTSNCCPPFFFV